MTASAVTPDVEKRGRQLQHDVLTWRPLSDVSDVHERSLLSANMTGATQAIRFKKLPPASNSTEVIRGLVTALVEKHGGLFSELKVKAMATLLRWRGVAVTGRLLDTRRPEFAKSWDGAKPSDAALRRAMSTGESAAPMEVDSAPESKSDDEDGDEEDECDGDGGYEEDARGDADNGSQPTAQQLAMIGRTFCDLEDCDQEKFIVHTVKFCGPLGTIAAFYGSYGESIASDAQLERLPVDDLLNSDWVEWCDGNDGEGGADGIGHDDDCGGADDAGASGADAGSSGDDVDGAGASADNHVAYDDDGPADDDLEAMMAAMEQSGTVGLGDDHAADHSSDAAASDSDEEDEIPIAELVNAVRANFDSSSVVTPSRGTIDSKQPINDLTFFNQVSISFRQTDFVLGRFGPNMSLCPIIEEEDDSRWIVRVEDIYTDDDGDELFYMSYFFSESQLRGDNARQPPRLAKNELVESVNVYPAALGDIVGFVHVVHDKALATGDNRTRGGLPVHFVSSSVVYDHRTKRLTKAKGGGLRVADYVQMGT